MRTPRVVAVVVFAALTLSGTLAGCTATTPIPKGPSEDELNALVQVQLDRQWGYTGLDGVVERPNVAVEKVGSVDGFSEEFGICMSDAGFNSWGVDDTGLDMSSVNPDGAATTPDQQLAYYLCNARFPGVDTLSEAQLDFVYDYYQRWLIPCIEQHGYTVIGLPSRQDFSESRAQMGWQWTPYAGLTKPPSNADTYTALQRECRPTIPGIEGWSDEYQLF